MRMLGHIAADFIIALVCITAALWALLAFASGLGMALAMAGEAYGALGVIAVVALILGTLFATAFTVDQYRKRQRGEIID